MRCFTRVLFFSVFVYLYVLEAICISLSCSSFFSVFARKKLC